MKQTQTVEYKYSKWIKFFVFWLHTKTGGSSSLFNADVAKLVDAPDLGSGSLQSGGSIPFIRTSLNLKRFGPIAQLDRASAF